jgi:hypothetical protein
MVARGRPFVALFATLLVWLTTLGSAGTAASRERRLLTAGDERVATISIAVPRSAAIAVREVTRLPVLTDGAPAMLVAGAFDAPVPSIARRDAHTAHGRVRQAQGLASTYDATAPPNWLAS